jgi:hypothetical protein
MVTATDMTTFYHSVRRARWGKRIHVARRKLRAERLAQ